MLADLLAKNVEQNTGKGGEIVSPIFVASTSDQLGSECQDLF